jgi:hypothetical protein
MSLHAELGLSVPRDEEMNIEKDGVHIQILPVWKWLLSAPL